jgi:hydrogenase nickel incorporation protein HypA/HybF
MHEMGIAEGILAVVLDAAEDQKVRRIRIQVGKLQMIVRESLEFSFQLVADGTQAAEAALEIEEVSARFRCNTCGHESQLDHPPFVCVGCGAPNLEVVSGDQILLDEVEREDGVTLRRLLVDTDEILEEHLREHHGHDHHGHDHEHED